MNRAWRNFVAAPPLALVLVLPEACQTKKPPPDDPPPVVVSAPVPVPPVAFSGAPASTFADAALEGKSPYEQARAYEASGQYWLARLVLERKALGESGTKAEIELLASLCHQQEDEACIEECSKRLGRKLKFDGGAPRARLVTGEHKEPDSDLARARDHLLGRRFGEARAILESKVIGGTASREEIRLLSAVCKEQGDRMCIALCEAKLKGGGAP